MIGEARMTISVSVLNWPSWKNHGDRLNRLLAMSLWICFVAEVKLLPGVFNVPAMSNGPMAKLLQGSP
jgi:hypothetical protein